MKIAFTGNVFPFGEGFAYGGERILYYLVQELSRLGHEVYLFAREGCNIPPEVVVDYTPVGPLCNDHDVHYNAVRDYSRAHRINFDVYHCNYFGDGWTRESQETWPYVELVWNRWCHAAWQLQEKPFNVVSYSRVLQQDFRDNPGIETTMIHYGIPEDLYTFSPDHDGYAVWIGKLEGGKNPEAAIRLAKAAGLKIVVMGPPYNTGCFWKEVGPYIDNETVFWVRGVDDAQKQKIMSRAKVFIYSNDSTWKEHFGIVTAESLAMGTPVLVFNRTGQDNAVKVDEIVQDGIQGFILEYTGTGRDEEIIEKGLPLLAEIGRIERRACREHFEKNFTSSLMALRYDWFYGQVAQGKRFGCAEIPI